MLSEAETSLHRLMEQGLKEHRYADVAQVADLADGLARLLRGEVLPTKRWLASTAPEATEAKRPATTTKKTEPRAEKREYPRFEREGDRLIKIGWSKKRREQYEHRAPRDAVLAFIRHLASHAQEGQVFAMEDVLPVPDFSGGEVPAYQAYLTLAWLQHAGAVEKKGRDGYSLLGGSLADDGFAKLWADVPAR